MNYAPTGKFLWDSWFITQGGVHHAFYLQADRIGDPDDRIDNTVSIGHATSTNLVDWTEGPVALEPGTRDEWDNLSLWTGSVIEHEGQYVMFYTGRNTDPDQHWIQRIGMATSSDLFHWEKSTANPLLEAVEHYTIDNHINAVGKPGTWRDPFVFKDPSTNLYYMTISARERGDKTEYNGCVALAESPNLMDWTLLPPLFSPGVYDEIETTQVVIHNEHYYLFFSTHAQNYEPNFAKTHGAYGGLHCYYSNSLTGEYMPVNGNGVVLENGPHLYDVRLLHKEDDEYTGIGWLNMSDTGEFIGRLSHPLNVTISGDRVTPRPF